MTYSVDTIIPPLTSPMNLNLGSSYDESITGSPHDNRTWWIVYPAHNNYRIQMEGSDGFHILLTSGEKFSSDKNSTFIVSKRQLALLQAGGVSINILGPSNTM
jgi:hypothetical protein